MTDQSVGRDWGGDISPKVDLIKLADDWDNTASLMTESHHREKSLAIAQALRLQEAMDWLVAQRGNLHCSKASLGEIRAEAVATDSIWREGRTSTPLAAIQALREELEPHENPPHEHVWRLLRGVSFSPDGWFWLPAPSFWCRECTTCPFSEHGVERLVPA